MVLSGFSMVFKGFWVVFEVHLLAPELYEPHLPAARPAPGAGEGGAHGAAGAHQRLPAAHGLSEGPDPAEMAARSAFQGVSWHSWARNQRFNAGVNKNDRMPQGQRSYFSKTQSLPELQWPGAKERKRFEEDTKALGSMT